MSGQDSSALEFNAEWLRDQRSRLGWSTITAANRAREKAREFGDAIKLSQQLVSKFENGRLKSIPRWLGYMQLAMADEVREKGLPDGKLWTLRLPDEAQVYFADRAPAREPTQYYSMDQIVGTENRVAVLDDLMLLQELSDEDRAAVRQLMRSLAERASKTSPRSVHAKRRSFAGLGKRKGEAA